jgi:hypothetical protein
MMTDIANHEILSKKSMRKPGPVNKDEERADFKNILRDTDFRIRNAVF